MIIPDSVRRLLVEYHVPAEPAGTSWERVVTERIMLRGTWADMLWLRATFSREQLASYLRDRGHRVLPPRELRFWSTVCHVPGPVADAWVARARQAEREWRG